MSNIELPQERSKPPRIPVDRHYMDALRERERLKIEQARNPPRPAPRQCSECRSATTGYEDGEEASLTDRFLSPGGLAPRRGKGHGHGGRKGGRGLVAGPPAGEAGGQETGTHQGMVCNRSTHNRPDVAPDDTVKVGSTYANRGVTVTKTPSDSGAYLIRKWPGSKAQGKWVNALFRGRTEAQRGFFMHVLICRLLRHAGRGPWVPVGYALMHRGLPDCPRETKRVWGPLVDADLIEVDDYYSHRTGESREFTVPARLVHAFLNLGAGEDGETRFDLVTGKRDRRRTAHRTILKSASENRYPELIDGTLRHFQKVRRHFNRSAIERHVSLQYEAATAAYDELSRVGWAEENVEYSIYQKALGRYETDHFAYQLIMQQDLQYEDGDIWSYAPAYEVQELSGRLTEIGGGLQSCSREMKAASVEGVAYTNYDIVSSQLYGLKQGFEEAGIGTEPIDRLLSTDKAEIAKGIGMTVDTYKSCLYALLFHGSLYPTLEDALRVRYQNPRSLRREVKMASIPKAIFDGAPPDPSAVYRAFSELMWPLYMALQSWHAWLTGPYWKDVRKRSRGWFAINDCGVGFRPAVYEPGHERTAKMAAWYLQGKEACLVHHLTLLGSKYGYTAVANEHDGLLTDSEIPQEAIGEALTLASFKYARFEIKSIGATLWHSETSSISTTTTTTTTTTTVSSPTTAAITIPLGRTSPPSGAATTSTIISDASLATGAPPRNHRTLSGPDLGRPPCPSG